MRQSPRAISVSLLLALLSCAGPVAAQELTLSAERTRGLQHFIEAAQAGRLGEDVRNANVGVFKHSVEIELVRTRGPNQHFLLTRKDSTQNRSRYFNVEPGAGATASDAERVGQLVDECLGADPFRPFLDFYGASTRGRPLPSLLTAWRDRGWRGALQAFESHFIAPPGLWQTATIFAMLAALLIAGLIVIWTGLVQSSSATAGH
jgi:hypothetical protein